MTTSQNSGVHEGVTALRWVALAALAMVLSTVSLAPILAHWGRLEALPIYAAFGSVCHQQGERSCWLLGHPLAVCVRCWGVYWGALAAALFGLRLSKQAFLWAALVVVGTWTLEASELMLFPPEVRFLSGAAIGVTGLAALWGKRASRK